MKKDLSIGALAARTGLSVSAIRFYETRGLVTPIRNGGRQRRYQGSDIRRLSFVLIAQRIGLTIEQIGNILADLPHGRTPTRKDWHRIGKTFRTILDQRIAMMERMCTRLDGCIGCGCLSLKSCSLYNPDDKVGHHGPGPRYILGDRPEIP